MAVTSGAVVQVTRVETGEMRELPLSAVTGLDWCDEGVDYMWSEGNYACDCNRALFFARAGKEPDAERALRPCSDGKYRVRIIVDGSTVFDDHQESTAHAGAASSPEGRSQR